MSTAAGSAEDREVRTADRIDIVELMHAYARYFDLNQPDEIAELFTDDARIDYGPEVPAIEGKEQIAGRIGAGLERIFAATSHHISNASVWFDAEDRARGEFYVYAWHRYVDGTEGHLWGRYQTGFQRTREGWRIASLLLQAAGTKDFHRRDMNPIGRA